MKTLSIIEKLKQKLFRYEEPVENFMDVKITYACNFKCEYCYQSDEKTGWRPQDRMLSKENAENFIHFLGRFDKTFSITLAGGEPLVYPHLEYLCENICKLGHKVNIVTNFSLPFERIEKIVHYIAQSKGVINISIHLSQWPDIQDFYSRLQKLIDLKIQNNYSELTILLTCVITEDNFEKAREIRKYINEHFLIPLELQRCYSRGGQYYPYPANMESELTKMGLDVPEAVANNAVFTGYLCWTGSRFFYIESDGVIKSCYAYRPGEKDYNVNVLGNLSEYKKVKIYNLPQKCKWKHNCICYKHFIRQKFIINGQAMLDKLEKKTT
jgi:MoaA/NifB/PqqE/SkfB family radical SAM enzyme